MVYENNDTVNEKYRKENKPESLLLSMVIWRDSTQFISRINGPNDDKEKSTP